MLGLREQRGLAAQGGSLQLRLGRLQEHRDRTKSAQHRVLGAQGRGDRCCRTEGV